MDFVKLFKKILFVLLSPLYVMVAIIGQTWDWWQELWG